MKQFLLETRRTQCTLQGTQKPHIVFRGSRSDARTAASSLQTSDLYNKWNTFTKSHLVYCFNNKKINAKINSNPVHWIKHVYKFMPNTILPFLIFRSSTAYNIYNSYLCAHKHNPIIPPTFTFRKLESCNSHCEGVVGRGMYVRICVCAYGCVCECALATFPTDASPTHQLHLWHSPSSPFWPPHLSNIPYRCGYTSDIHLYLHSDRHPSPISP